MQIDRRSAMMPVTVVLIAAAMVVACSRPSRDARSGDSARAAAAIPDHSMHGAAGDSSAAAPEALRPIMQRLAVEMAGLGGALWMENYDEMTARSAAIAGHAEISSEELQRVKRILGRETPAFDSLDMQVHLAAERMHAAAQMKDMNAFLTAYSDVQRGCTSCHTQFRARLSTVTGTRSDSTVSP
jgi:cytochrome c556